MSTRKRSRSYSNNSSSSSNSPSSLVSTKSSDSASSLDSIEDEQTKELLPLYSPSRRFKLMKTQKEMKKKQSQIKTNQKSKRTRRSKEHLSPSYQNRLMRRVIKTKSLHNTLHRNPEDVRIVELEDSQEVELSLNGFRNLEELHIINCQRLIKIEADFTDTIKKIKHLKIVNSPLSDEIFTLLFDDGSLEKTLETLIIENSFGEDAPAIVIGNETDRNYSLKTVIIKSLNTSFVKISNCSKLNEVRLETMRSLETFIIDNSKVKDKIEILNSSVNARHEITALKIDSCHINNTICANTRITDFFTNKSKIKKLELEQCSHLKKIQINESTIRELTARECSSALNALQHQQGEEGFLFEDSDKKASFFVKNSLFREITIDKIFLDYFKFEKTGIGILEMEDLGKMHQLKIDECLIEEIKFKGSHNWSNSPYKSLIITNHDFKKTKFSGLELLKENISLLMSQPDPPSLYSGKSSNGHRRSKTLNIDHFLNKMKKIKRIEMRNFTDLTGINLSNLQYLTHIVIHDVPNISQIVCINLPKLQKFELHEEPERLAVLILDKCENLKSMRIPYWDSRYSSRKSTLPIELKALIIPLGMESMVDERNKLKRIIEYKVNEETLDKMIEMIKITREKQQLMKSRNASLNRDNDVLRLVGEFSRL
jgi:hypothetical protein